MRRWWCFAAFVCAMERSLAPYLGKNSKRQACTERGVLIRRCKWWGYYLGCNWLQWGSWDFIGFNIFLMIETITLASLRCYCQLLGTTSIRTLLLGGQSFKTIYVNNPARQQFKPIDNPDGRRMCTWHPVQPPKWQPQLRISGAFRTIQSNPCYWGSSLIYPSNVDSFWTSEYPIVSQFTCCDPHAIFRQVGVILISTPYWNSFNRVSGYGICHMTPAYT